MEAVYSIETLSCPRNARLYNPEDVLFNTGKMLSSFHPLFRGPDETYSIFWVEEQAE
jgi:hypothetical protein